MAVLPPFFHRFLLDMKANKIVKSGIRSKGEKVGFGNGLRIAQGRLNAKGTPEVHANQHPNA
jgi:hypothetical protein